MTPFPPPSPQPAPHSNETERRLTTLELETERRLTTLELEQSRHSQKLSLHEKAILGLASSMYVLAQDRFPQIAAVIRGLLIP